VPRIFVSYRRLDCGDVAGRLYDYLIQRFGKDSIFMDVNGGIEPGADFQHTIQHAIDKCDVLLALIGPQWMTCTDEQGRRRLENENDPVRGEIATAIKRNTLLFPVVFGDTPPPTDNLPSDIADLTKHQFSRIRNESWGHDVRRLFAAIDSQAHQISNGLPISIAPITGVERVLVLPGLRQPWPWKSRLLITLSIFAMLSVGLAIGASAVSLRAYLLLWAVSSVGTYLAEQRDRRLMRSKLKPVEFVLALTQTGRRIAVMTMPDLRIDHFLREALKTLPKRYHEYKPEVLSLYKPSLEILQDTQHHRLPGHLTLRQAGVIDGAICRVALEMRTDVKHNYMGAGV
jgi:hypothetical protein